MLFKRVSAILSFVTVLSLFQTVSADDAAERKCGYICNIQGSRYGNTISQNNGKTLYEHAKQLGSQYQYYMLCCDGVLKGRENITLVSKDLKVLPNSIVKMKGEFPYMPINRYCSTYCAHDLDKRISYFKYSEELTFEKFVKKYSADKYKNQYHLFTYCCDGQFKSDRMTLTRDFTQFSLHIPSFKVDSNSLSQVKTQIKKQLLNNSCSYYCNVKNKSIISISKSNGKKIQEYAKGLSNAYDSVIKCCDGKVNQKSNVAVYNKSNSVSYYQDISTPYLFDFTNFDIKCDNYCGFNTSKKTVTLFQNPQKTVLQSAKAFKSSYDYVTYCCYGKKEIKGILVTTNANGEERAIDTEGYSIKIASSAVSNAVDGNLRQNDDENNVEANLDQDTTNQETPSQETTSQETTVQDTTGQENYDQETYGQDTTGQETTVQDTTGQETVDQNTTGQETIDQETTVQDTTVQDTTGQETFDQDTTGQETIDQNTTGQETFGQDNTNQESYVQDAPNEQNEF
ncbi:hypothetical protein PIROE2DRAFT_6458 [Piromyces sp. E2]|nr:hypothetical protein PIROE2DRAFT_6458 [Piromyces sp. E2]|eukprot:OUM66322.1 hypothetical protein PIROE2DRAFT_6458 [Piromyces sp. E2]